MSESWNITISNENCPNQYRYISREVRYCKLLKELPFEECTYDGCPLRIMRSSRNGNTS